MKDTSSSSAPPRRWIPALPTLSAAMLLPSLSPLPEPMFPFTRPSSAPVGGGPQLALYHMARNGIHHGLCALGVGAGDAVLMPAYHHGVEVEAVRSTGARVVFFRVDRRMRADLDDAARLARTTPGARVLYLTHYAGFAQPVDEARALCRTFHLLLVEDCALSLYSSAPSGRPLGLGADLAVYCLYKTLPVPHGGLVVTAPSLPRAASPPLWPTLHHVAGSLRARARMRGESVLFDAARAAARRTVDPFVGRLPVGTSSLDPAQLSLGASSLVTYLLRRSNAASIIVRRRRNYHLLLEALQPRAREAMELARGECPLFFPLHVDDKSGTQAALLARGIEAVDFWRTGDAACDARRFPEVAELRRTLLELPIHQDLDDEDIAEVARAVKCIAVDAAGDALRTR